MTLPKIELSGAGQKSDALILGWFQKTSEGKDKGKASGPQFDFKGKRSKDVDALEKLLHGSKHFFAKKNETNFLRYYPFEEFQSVLLLGLGASAKWNPEMARQAGAALSLTQRRERLSVVTLMAETVFAGVDEKSLPDFLQAFCEGYLLAGWEYKELKKPEPDPFVPESLQIMGLKGQALEARIKRADVLARAVNFARSLGDRPGNFLTPTEFGKLLQKMSKERGLKCQVLGQSEIEKEKMGLLLGVSRGSAEEPRFIILEHRGGKKGDKPVALVGKGITFDSGGISLKPALRMEDMKYDMMGAAAVSGIFQALADLKIPQNVVGIIATCENMPGGKAQKPGDVARGRSGKTVEIINTDAEGRLILGDALDYVQTEFTPEAIIDFATLTGAVVDALGTVCSGVMGNSPALIQRIKEASQQTGERVWELPLFEEYEEDLKSSVADIKNSGVREAGSSKGGTFLKAFVDPKYPWVHCDIAGSAYHRKDLNYHNPKYGAGIMVRLVTQLLTDWTPLK